MLRYTVLQLLLGNSRSRWLNLMAPKNAQVLSLHNTVSSIWAVLPYFGRFFLHPRSCHFGGLSFFNVVGLAYGSNTDALWSYFMYRECQALYFLHQDDTAFFVTVPVEAGNCLWKDAAVVSKIFSRFARWSWSTDLVIEPWETLPQILNDVDIDVAGILIDFPKQPDFQLDAVDIQAAWKVSLYNLSLSLSL